MSIVGGRRLNLNWPPSVYLHFMLRGCTPTLNFNHLFSHLFHSVHPSPWVLSRTLEYFFFYREIPFLDTLRIALLYNFGGSSFRQDLQYKYNWVKPNTCFLFIKIFKKLYRNTLSTRIGKYLKLQPIIDKNNQ